VAPQEVQPVLEVQEVQPVLEVQEVQPVLEVQEVPLQGLEGRVAVEVHAIH